MKRRHLSNGSRKVQFGRITGLKYRLFLPELPEEKELVKHDELHIHMEKINWVPFWSPMKVFGKWLRVPDLLFFIPIFLFAPNSHF